MATTKTLANAASLRCVSVMLGVMLAFTGSLSAWGADETPLATQSGITKVSHLGPALTEPDDSTKDQVIRYGLGFILQVAPRTAAVLCNVRTIGEGHWDWENGADAVVFDDLATIGRQKRLTLTRNEYDQNPATGKKRVAVTYPTVGGFVPLGAKRPDGSAHPNAGTGFGIANALCYDLNEQGYYIPADATAGGQYPSSSRWYVHQFAYDDKGLRIVKAEMMPCAGNRLLLPDVRKAEVAKNKLKTTDGVWAITAGGLSAAIPDGDDLLLPVMANDGKLDATGVSRWGREDGDWHPVAFYAVSDGTEPTLIRDIDGALLYSVRDAGGGVEAVGVWRSPDNGKTWKQVFYDTKLRSNAPVALHQAADGTPLIAADQPGSFRAKLCLWPLTADCTGCGPAIMARDCVQDFGPPPEGTLWFADHPTGATVQLADGQWHRLLAYRVLAFKMGGAGKETPTPQTGCHIQEVFSAGPARPSWKF
jgi:hypothetical protein